MECGEEIEQVEAPITGDLQSTGGALQRSIKLGSRQWSSQATDGARDDFEQAKGAIDGATGLGV